MKQSLANSSPHFPVCSKFSLMASNWKDLAYTYERVINFFLQGIINTFLTLAKTFVDSGVIILIHSDIRLH